MAAGPLTAVSTARLVALKTQGEGTVVSQFGDEAISVLRSFAGINAHWAISVINDFMEPLNVVYVRQGDATKFEKAYVVEYREGDTLYDRVGGGRLVQLGDFHTVDAALSAALLLAVELYR